MKPASLRLALLLSVALNLGVIATVTLDRLRPPAAARPALHQLLGLDADQRVRWEAAERPFLAQLDAATTQLEAHRTALIDALFADTIDSVRIESARAAIAELQQTQQRLIIEQLIAERAILDAPQRARLATLLRDQPGTRSTVEDLHGR